MKARTDVDLNLLTAFDRLLETCSVTQAAHDLHLSVPAMSHTLARIRVAFGDPILVRSGRQLVPTPRAEELRLPVRAIVEQTQSLLRRPGPFDPANLARTFVIRASDALVGTVGPRIAEVVVRSAPGVTLRFTPEGDRDDIQSLRGDGIDLSITGGLPVTPDIEQMRLFEDSFVGLVRTGHPLLGDRITRRRFADSQHVVMSRRGTIRGPIDELLEAAGLDRHVSLVVPTFYAAAFAATTSDLVATIPRRLAKELTNVAALTAFTVPLELPSYAVVVGWHRRLTADPAHRWLRSSIRRAIPR